MPATFSSPRWVSDHDMHHGTCVTHVSWCMPGPLTIGFLWSRWRGKCSRHSRRMRNPQFYVSGKRPMCGVVHPRNMHTVYACDVLCLLSVKLPISSRITSFAQKQSHDYLSAYKISQNDCGKYILRIHYKLIFQWNKTRKCKDNEHILRDLRLSGTVYQYILYLRQKIIGLLHEVVLEL